MFNSSEVTTKEDRLVLPTSFDFLIARIETGSHTVKALAALGCASVAIGLPVGVVIAGATGNKEAKHDTTLQTCSSAAFAIQKCVEYTPSNPDC